MSTKASISSGQNFHLYHQELLSAEPNSVFLELNNPKEFRIERGFLKGQSWESLLAEISAEDMDKMAIDWIKTRKLQGSVGGPVGQEWGSPDCPWE